MSIVPTSPQFDPERGAILLISLIMIVVMTVLAIASFDDSKMVQRITKNMINFSRADNANDAGQIAAALWLNSLTERPNTCTASPCGANLVWKRAMPGGPTPPLAETMDDAWWSVNGRTVSGTIYGVKNQPLYVISEGSCDNAAMVRYYRIVSKSVGSTDPPEKFSVVTVKSTLPPPVSIIFDVSSVMSYAMPEYTGVTFEHIFNPLVSGNIAGIWLGYGSTCNPPPLTATVVLSGPGKPTVSYTLTFTVPDCSGDYGPRKMMGYAAIPTPYPVLQSDSIKLNIKNLSAGASLHMLGSDFTKPIPFRTTLDGTADMCQ